MSVQFFAFLLVSWLNILYEMVVIHEFGLQKPQFSNGSIFQSVSYLDCKKTLKAEE